MNDYLELQSYLSHSKKKKSNISSYKGDDWAKTLYINSDGHITGYNSGSKAGMPTNLKQESSNIKRASERAKFMNQLQQVCRSIKTLDERLGQTGKTQLNLFERKEVSSPNGGKSSVTSLKNGGRGGANTANTELGNLRQKYSAKVAPLEKQLHNLLNAGKNSPLFTDAEKEKMRKWMQEGGTLSELATVYSDIFGSVAHSSLEEDNMVNEYTEINAYLQHGLFDIFKSKPKYTSTGSRAGMPSNIHLGDSTSPSSKSSAIQDELVRMNKKLVEYNSGQEKAKAEYDRYRKLAKETENRIRDLERSRDAAIKESVNYTGRQTSVTSSAPDKTKLVRTNPIFDAAAAEALKRKRR